LQVGRDRPENSAFGTHGAGYKPYSLPGCSPRDPGADSRCARKPPRARLHLREAATPVPPRRPLIGQQRSDPQRHPAKPEHPLMPSRGTAGHSLRHLGLISYQRRRWGRARVAAARPRQCPSGARRSWRMAAAVNYLAEIIKPAVL